MAYSDYGGYAFFKAKGTDEWVARPECSDTSVKNYLDGNPPPTERPIEAHTGLKMDVLIHADPSFGKRHEDGYDDTYRWNYIHAHHVVFGDEILLAFMHKSYSPTLMAQGTGPFFSTTEYNEELDEDVEIDQSGVIPPGYRLVHEACGGVRYAHLETPAGDWLAVSGYGVGDHWWIAEKTRLDSGGTKWPTQDGWLTLAKGWLLDRTRRADDSPY